ncbi:hypothetical protein KEU06_13355 [Pseudaminobacter sp. 19-2017]|uniref:DUF1127 domain-containing protein n=1 Tax=Pseudaminobacter soli (ex Zhang et al. 2022) TaxID=2831468 RepID=A0A942I9P3_9HYPH|nr:hypothetical protein [Pseudaminobacter soli]MBS3649596.1 hypothetical protein [Pseudaminobacter soli]
MSILNDIGRLGASLRKARRNQLAVREMNALPPELQKDIGWPADPGAKSVSTIRSAYWMSLR